ncbi:uncharacterized protein LOC6534097 [Drosophila yakuba]|uniref:MADF domain-containing protein n=1 Tax=Drosophila yakuba TaxID=7245 RepID=B4PI20_DROYA|nr:uncharacterized protein LOC6534097 [Drosophila yakuba]EDW94495.1 uncharacterized protein Dyak_GE22013 [Drosophila yakuba]
MNTRRRSIASSPNVYAINAKICHLVEQHPCLYDRHDDDYLRKSTVKNAWKEISSEMRNSVKSCKERWRNIRSSYARSIKVHHGANTYYLNSELQFLQRHITPGVPVPLRGRRSRARGQKEHVEGELETPVEAILEMVHSPSCLDSEHAQSRHSTDSESAKESDLDKNSWLGRVKKRLPSEFETSNCNIEASSTMDFEDTVPAEMRTESESREEAKTSTRDIEALPIMDFDDAFLQGLRPEIKHMNFHQKLYFKRRVYDLLGEIFHSEESASSSHPAQPHSKEKVNGTLSTTTSSPSPANPLQHLGLMLQLPKRVAKAPKEL